ncbi:MAG TPA: hypothetical protein VGB66_06005 [Longimicrobium sp.]|jgi:hypothetical protein
MLDEDVRRIREKVRAAEHRDSLDFDFRLDAGSAVAAGNLASNVN